MPTTNVSSFFTLHNSIFVEALNLGFSLVVKNGTGPTIFLRYCDIKSLPIYKDLCVFFGGNVKSTHLKKDLSKCLTFCNHYLSG